MPDRSTYEPGTPCWADLVTPDVEAATAFYTGLFGWDAEVDSPDGHTMLHLGGRPVTALMPHVAEAPPGTPALWTTYVSVADVEASAAAAVKAGGRLFTGPADAAELGRYALLFDTQNAHIGLWQPGTFHGASLVNEPGAYCWSELAVRDVDAAKAFYGATFGWDGETHPFGPTTYTEWHGPGGPRLGGMLQIDDQGPAEVAPHWMVYFAVADCDTTAARARELGGIVSVAPKDIPTGRFAVLGDPQGGLFSVIRLAAV
ncbi:VOC family protein [Actinomadura sp. DC4]|uniref:VOC family protein n=1 Tax=Actinomadura sp. DC4 TaxID=3055069 RepID=UPI0025AEE47F|nr:VOC family protein [Actinomadura sp. DC4]MDN3356287.1 VOC family protein [Actinomadura sp. DC4]